LRTVALISADAEWRAVRSLVPGEPSLSPLGEFIATSLGGWTTTLFHGGWGRVSASATAQYTIDRWNPDLLVNLGTCGGFEGRASRGEILLVDRTLIYDIVEQMTDAEAAIQHYSTDLDLSWLGEPLPPGVRRAVIVSGDRDVTPESISNLVKKYDAVAADWESAAIAWVCRRNRKRVLILRGVSDVVGSSGGEAYGDYELFVNRTAEIMRRLLEMLPDWLELVQDPAPSSET